MAAKKFFAFFGSLVLFALLGFTYFALFQVETETTPMPETEESTEAEQSDQSEVPPGGAIAKALAEREQILEEIRRYEQVIVPEAERLGIATSNYDRRDEVRALVQKALTHPPLEEALLLAKEKDLKIFPSDHFFCHPFSIFVDTSALPEEITRYLVDN